jgi:hypothetical protein
MAGQLIAASRQFLFLGEQLGAGSEPFIARDDLMIRHDCLPSG